MQPYVTLGPVWVGEPILLTASVAEAGLPVLSADVSVEVTDPLGQTSSVTLYDDGAHEDNDPDDGKYARQFTHTSVPGIYHFTFRALGLARNGQKVSREATRDKEVYPGQHGQPPVVGGPSGEKPVMAHDHPTTMTDREATSPAVMSCVRSCVSRPRS